MEFEKYTNEQPKSIARARVNTFILIVGLSEETTKTVLVIYSPCNFRGGMADLVTKIREKFYGVVPEVMHRE